MIPFDVRTTQRAPCRVISSTLPMSGSSSPTLTSKEFVRSWMTATPLTTLRTEYSCKTGEGDDEGGDVETDAILASGRAGTPGGVWAALSGTPTPARRPKRLAPS